MKDILEILETIVTPLPIYVILFILVIIHIDKIKLFISFLIRPFSLLFSFVNRVAIAFEYEGKINGYCNRIAPDFFDKKLKIKWLSSLKDKSFSKTENDEITVYVHTKENNNLIIIDVLAGFITPTLFPSLSFSVEKDFMRSNELFINNKLVDEFRNGSLTDLYKKNVYDKDINDQKLKYLQQMQTLDNKNFYFYVFLDAIKQVNEQTVSSVYDIELSQEILNFFNFLYTVSIKEKEENPDLTFPGRYFRYSLILVAKEETLSRSGVEAHIWRVKEECRNVFVNRIYIAGFGNKNITNIKRICHRLNGLNGLNITHVLNLDVTTIDGKKHPSRLVIIDNYYDKETSGVRPDDKNEVESLLETFIPEVRKGYIEVKAIAREKGYVTKVLVSAEQSYNPLARCVGTDGVRKDRISQKLNDEHLDFIEDTGDIKEMIENALYPLQKSEILNIFIKSSEKSAIIVVKDERLIGKGCGRSGFNIKLASELIGWKMKITTEEKYLKEKVSLQTQHQTRN